MNRGLFTADLKALTDEAASRGVSGDDIKNAVLKIIEKCKEDAESKNASKTKSETGKSKKNTSPSRSTKDLFERFRHNISLTTMAVAFILTTGIAIGLNKVVESKFSPKQMYKNFQDERCLVDNLELFTEMTRPRYNCSSCAGLTRVDEVTSISKEEFRLKYAYTDVPLLVKGGAKDWSAMNMYSFNYFRSLYKETPGAFESVEHNCMFFHYRTTLLGLEDVFNMTDARARLDEGEKTWYIGWCDSQSTTERELKKHYKRPSYLPEAAEGEEVPTDWIFMGWPGPGAHIHIDMVAAPSWQAQVSGTKTWMLYPSVECDHVCSPMNVTLEAGDILTVDTNKWFHSTYIHPGNISISIGSEY